MKQFIKYWRLPFGTALCIHSAGFWVKKGKTSLIVKYPNHPVYFSERNGYGKHLKLWGFRIGIDYKE